MGLLLTTPEQHSFQDPTLELNEKRLQRWLDCLPVLDAGESLRQMLAALEPLNEQQLDADKRLALMALYQNTFGRLYATAEPLRLRQQPLSRQQRQEIVDDVERLSAAIANGFKLSLKGLYAQGERCQPVKFARALRWTLQALAAALLHSYRFYRPEPGFVFLELNQVYRLARHRGLHELAAGDGDDAARVSLAASYAAINLLSLCDPFSLEEGAADGCYRSLLQYAGGTRLVPGNSWQGVPEGLFFIDLQSDSRPRHCVSLESPVCGDDPHILDARAALQQMHRTLVALPAERRRQRAETVLLKALLPQVDGRDQRRSERRRDGRWIELIVGLEQTHAWLASSRQRRMDDLLSMQVKDVSEGGYCLSWQGGTSATAQVGELLCVVSDSGGGDAAPGQLLQIRWLRDSREREMELGVQWLAGVPSAVYLAPVDDSGARRLPALFLPSATDGEPMAARLLAPAEVYAENRALLLYVGQREVAIRCGVLLEHAPGFDCFEFRAA